MSDDYARDLEVLRNELTSYSKELTIKPWFIALSKTDTADEETLSRIADFSSESDATVLSFSSVSGIGVTELKDEMWRQIQKVEKSEENDVTAAGN
jgi:GTP-binding protein